MVVVVQLLSHVQLSEPHDLPGSSIHEILQARILEWVAISSSKLMRLIRISQVQHSRACVLVHKYMHFICMYVDMDFCMYVMYVYVH